MTYFEERRRELNERTAEDFEFLVTCESKHNMGMYHLLRDRTLEADRQRLAFELAFFGLTL